MNFGGITHVVTCEINLTITMADLEILESGGPPMVTYTEEGVHYAKYI